MGEFTVGGKRFQSAGPTATADEVAAAVNFIKQQRERDAAKTAETQQTNREIARNAPPIPAPPGMVDESGMPVTTEPPVAPREYPDAPSTLQLPQTQAHGLQTYDTPWAAAKDLARGVYDPTTKKWFGGSPATRDIAKVPSLLAGTLGPLSTDDPKHRQEIYVEQIPGAKAAEDKFGNPMIEYNGEKYYTSGKDLDRLRTALAVIGGTAIGASLPASGPLAIALGGIAGSVGQSVAEDLAAKESGSKGDTVDLEKAGWAALFGSIPGVAAFSRPTLGRLVYQLSRGAPMTDDMLRSAGLTTGQIESLTPAMRDEITKVARTTLNDQTAIGATYRDQLAKELGLTGDAGPTKGLLSGEADQIALEKRLAEQGGGADAAAIINQRRAAQDVKLNEAQERLQAQAGGHPGTPPRTPQEASETIQKGYDQAKATQKEATDEAYKLARDPAAVVAEGGTFAVPAPKAAELGRTTREALEKNDIGQIVTSSSGETSTPFAKKALEVVENWSKGQTGPRRFAMNEPGGTGIGLPDVTWQEAERLRQQLVALQTKANKAQGPAGGISQDAAAMQQIIDNFDKQFGPLNPLYAPARKANEELKSIFTSTGSVDHDAATKAVLKVMEGPEGGSAIVNTMFGGSFSKNQAGQMLEHLNTKVFPNHPEARDAIKEMALRRLLVDPKTGEALSPQKMVTAIDRGLGDQEGQLYKNLLSDDDFRLLKQLHEQQKLIASGRSPINPSRSGTILSTLLMKGGGLATGGFLGSETDLGTAGTIGGAALGALLSHRYPIMRANRAVSPPAGYLQSGSPGKLPATVGVPVGGLLADEANKPPGPADRLMEGLIR